MPAAVPLGQLTVTVTVSYDEEWHFEKAGELHDTDYMRGTRV
ncbi:hypothetical protein [Brevibacillus reuszeri]